METSDKTCKMPVRTAEATAEERGVHLFVCSYLPFGLPQWTSSKESTCDAGGVSLIPGLSRSPGAGYGNPLQYSRLENSMDRESGGQQSIGLQRVGHD